MYEAQLNFSYNLQKVLFVVWCKKMSFDETGDNDKPDCPICMSALSDEDPFAFCCGHRFHSKCAFDHRRSNKEELLCPLCKAKVDNKLTAADSPFPIVDIFFFILGICVLFQLCQLSAHAILHGYNLPFIGVVRWVITGMFFLMKCKHYM